MAIGHMKNLVAGGDQIFGTGDNRYKSEFSGHLAGRGPSRFNRMNGIHAPGLNDLAG